MKERIVISAFIDIIHNEPQSSDFCFNPFTYSHELLFQKTAKKIADNDASIEGKKNPYINLMNIFQ